MAFLSGIDLKEVLHQALGTEQFQETRIKQAAYELSLGQEVYRTDSKERKIEILDSKNKLLEINAGQFCLLLTKETVCIPNNILAFISMKANEKFKGLINVSGFHLDPGFKGQILFSVYNAGPSTISLEIDKPYFLIWFSKLSVPLTETEAYNSALNAHQNQHGIPPKYIDALKRGELTSPSAIVSKIQEVDSELRNDIKEIERNLKDEVKEIERNLRNDVKEVDRKKTTIQSFITLGIGLLVTLCVKVYWDSKAEAFGYNRRVEEDRLINQIELSKKYPFDSVFYKKLDSAIDKKLRDTTRH